MNTWSGETTQRYSKETAHSANLNMPDVYTVSLCLSELSFSSDLVTRPCDFLSCNRKSCGSGNEAIDRPYGT